MKLLQNSKIKWPNNFSHTTSKFLNWIKLLK